MITSKSELYRYIAEDRKMNLISGGLVTKIKDFIMPNSIGNYLYLLRVTEYYCNINKWYLLPLKLFYRYRFSVVSRQLGFSIPINTCDSGLSLPHYGTIIISENTRIGKNCKIHACVNIGASGGRPEAPQIGDNVYIGPSCVLFGNITIANNITVAANATVNKSFTEEHVVIGGTPAKVIKKDFPNWFELH